MWITPDTNQEVSRYLRSAEEYAEEGRDSNALWNLIRAVKIIFDEIEVRGDE